MFSEEDERSLLVAALIASGRMLDPPALIYEADKISAALTARAVARAREEREDK